MVLVAELAPVLINKVKSKCCGIKEIKIKPRVMLRLSVLHNSLIEAEM